MTGVQQFFTHNYLLLNLYSSFLVLIPKTEGATSISQCRPIVLGNFFFKIILKFCYSSWVNNGSCRLSAQYAFNRGHHIHDTITLIF